MENRKRQHYNGEKDKEFIISSFKKCVTEKREMDVFLEKLISPFIKSQKKNILDACCGIGHIPYFLSEISPDSKFLGIDQTSYLIEEGKKLCHNKSNIPLKMRMCITCLKNSKKALISQLIGEHFHGYHIMIKC